MTSTMSCLTILETKVCRTSTHIQRDVDATQEVISILLASWCGSPVRPHRFGNLLEISNNMMQQFESYIQHAFEPVFAKNMSDVLYPRLISFMTTDGHCVIYLPIPLNPLISFSFLQASATETSSSWSLGWKITNNFSVRRAEMTVLVLKDICWCILPYVQME